MLFERRNYTLKPGATPAFWQAQEDRGWELVRPIQERLIGYFSNLSGPVDQVTHLYRYDSYEDWKRRLHGLYAVPELEPYFQTVRGLMTAQENAFYVPAPVVALNPLWGGGADWQPDQPLPRLAEASPRSLVQECCIALLPGAQPRYWQAWNELACDTGGAAILGRGSLIACLVSQVGQQHQVLVYRHFADLAAREQLDAARQSHPIWRRFMSAVAPLIATQTSRWLRPGPLPQLAPLFFHGD